MLLTAESYLYLYNSNYVGRDWLLQIIIHYRRPIILLKCESILIWVNRTHAMLKIAILPGFLDCQTHLNMNKWKDLMAKKIFLGILAMKIDLQKSISKLILMIYNASSTRTGKSVIYMLLCRNCDDEIRCQHNETTKTHYWL